MSEDFMGDDYGQGLAELQSRVDPYFTGSTPNDPHGNFANQERNAMTTTAEANYYNNNRVMHYRAANIIVPDRTQIDRPGAEDQAYELSEGRTKDVFNVIRGKKETHGSVDIRTRKYAIRTAKKNLGKAVRNTRKKRRGYFRARLELQRSDLSLVNQATDIDNQTKDVEEDGKVWTERTKRVRDYKGRNEAIGSGDDYLGYGWVDEFMRAKNAGAPISTITFNMAGILPDNKPFMDANAYYRVNHTLMQRSEKDIKQQKLDAMHFFNEHYGLNFQSDAKPIKGEEDAGSLQIPGLATLRRYAISPSLQTRSTTAVSEDHPIELHEKVHEAGWIATVIAKRGASLGGIFGGDKGKAVKPGTSMSYGYWVFMNPKFENDHAIIHFESSEPSFFGGASGHVAHHYQIHDFSVIDGMHITKGAFGTATSITTERKILGNKKKLGDLYGATKASVQTTINLTHL